MRWFFMILQVAFILMAIQYISTDLDKFAIYGLASIVMAHERKIIDLEEKCIIK
jgi:hypothetical protein